MDDKYMEMRSLRKLIDEIENDERRGLLITLVDDEMSISLLGVSDVEAFMLLSAACDEAESRIEDQINKLKS